MKKGTLHWLIDLFLSLFRDLSIQAQMKEIEDLAVLVHRQMTHQYRNYHNLDHVIGLLDETDAVQSLAALFHDIVYFQVDRGIAPEVCSLIAPYIDEKEEEIWLKPDLSPEDRMLRLTLGVFGFQTGQKLHINAGMNEFLSSLFMNQRLKALAPESLLLQLTACVEGTIPFRRSNPISGPFEELEKRVERVNQVMEIGLTQTEVEKTIERAVKFANQDVASFSSLTHDKFLEDNWKLLPEMNHALRSGGVYSIRDYRQALYRMDSFLSRLDVGLIFHSYKGKPTPEEIGELQRRVISNINHTRSFLSAKLVTAAILEALSEISGGDAPLALFMGEPPSDLSETERIENYLPEVEQSSLIDPNSDLVRLFQRGRQGFTAFDTPNAPLSLFLHKSLGPEKMTGLYSAARQMFEGELSADGFLNLVDGPVAAAVAQAAAKMMATRREALNEYARQRLG